MKQSVLREICIDPLDDIQAEQEHATPKRKKTMVLVQLFTNLEYLSLGVKRIYTPGPNILPLDLAHYLYERKVARPYIKKNTALPAKQSRH